MSLQAELERSGNWLFRWRSYLPMLLIFPVLLAMKDFRWPLGSHQLHEVWEFSCLGLSLLGLAIRAKTVGHAPALTSGRNTIKQIAAELNTTGVYSVVRHPLYLGNFLIWLGIAAFSCVWWLIAIFILTFWLYYERIMYAEEAFLRVKFGDEFERWAVTTPSFVPRLKQWRSATLPFSFRNVLRREYTGFLGIVACFFVLQTLEHVVVHYDPVFEPIYLALGVFAVMLYLILRTLKRMTSLLDVEGR